MKESLFIYNILSRKDLHYRLNKCLQHYTLIINIYNVLSIFFIYNYIESTKAINKLKYTRLQIGGN